MAESNEQTPNAGGDGTPKGEKPKIEFSEEQQAFIQKLIDGAYSKAFEKAGAEVSKATEQVSTLQKQIEEMNSKLQHAAAPAPKPKEDEVPPKPKKQAVTDEFQQQQEAKLAEMQALAESLRAEKLEAEKRAEMERQKNKVTRIKEEFIRASEKIDFFDRMEVFDLIHNTLELDESGRVVVMNPATKAPRINTNLEPMTLQEFLVEYAKEKPWKVKAKNPEGGTGGGESRKVDLNPNKPVDYSKLTNDEFLALTEQVIAKQYSDR